MTRRQKKNLIRIIITLVVFFTVFIIDKIIDLYSVIPNENYNFILPLCIYLAIYLFIGYDVLIKAFKNIIHGQVLDENFLMCIATIGAFAISSFSEGVAVILFYQVGEWFQSYAVGKSRKSITSLMDIRPDIANVYKDGNLVTVDPEEVQVDDIIVIKPGEKIPLDGIIIKGSSTIDTKALTGESLPKDVVIGDNVISGTVNLSSTLEVKVTKAFYDSTVSKILDLVENASSQKAKAENFITKFARFYTPTIVVVALLLAIIPSIITKDYMTWIYRALSFLVVSCPCALVISIPLSFFAGIGASSKYGILVKGSNYLEKFNQANIFVFDKTGTLTKGNFVVTKVYPESNKDEILHYASIAEYGSNHPIARSICNISNIEDNNGYTITDEAGYGIKAIKDSDIILCGNHKLMDKYNINYTESNDIGTIIYVARNNEFLGYILISDEIKEESKEAVTKLNSLGCKTVMLTGDNERIASSVANELGLSDYKASLLPNDKVTYLEEIIKNKGEKDIVTFVGDGINDAPSLMRSDVGIAMGGVGSDAAIEAADIVLMKDDLKGISLAKRIARKTMIIVYENIWFSLLVKLVILVLSACGITNMWFAVFGDVGVAFIAILNAMRVNSKYE